MEKFWILYIGIWIILSIILFAYGFYDNVFTLAGRIAAVGILLIVLRKIVKTTPERSAALKRRKNSKRT